MMPVTDGRVWWSNEIAYGALSDVVAALEVIGPPARYLGRTYLCVACDAGDGRAVS